MLRTLIFGARQIVTVTRSSNEEFLCGKDMQNIGIIKSNDGGLSLMIEKWEKSFALRKIGKGSTNQPNACIHIDWSWETLTLYFSICIHSENIVAIGTDEDIAREFNGVKVDKTIDASGCCILPGIIGFHTEYTSNLFLLRLCWCTYSSNMGRWSCSWICEKVSRCYLYGNNAWRWWNWFYSWTNKISDRWRTTRFVNRSIETYALCR